MTAYSIAYGREKTHAAALKLGLSSLPPNFVAEVCGVCLGEGAYRQLFNAGCGGGMYYMYSGCDYCDGTGLTVAGRPAPSSVVAQVLEKAGEAEA